jgi:hypothetical protein
MKRDERIAHQIACTTLDPVLVKRFCQPSPHYYQWGLAHRIDQRSLEQLNATDRFEFYLRFYLTSRHKTLQAVFMKGSCIHEGRCSCGSSFACLFTGRYSPALTYSGWYELLPRLKRSREQILALMPDVAVKPPGLFVI